VGLKEKAEPPVWGAKLDIPVAGAELPNVLKEEAGCVGAELKENAPEGVDEEPPRGVDDEGR
jgi:hypothetical protein